MTWSDTNNMILNNEKTAFSEREGTNDPIPFHCGDIVPSKCAKFLGVTVDSTLTFSDQVSQLLSKCYSQIFLMKQLKQIGMNSTGVLTFLQS